LREVTQTTEVTAFGRGFSVRASDRRPKPLAKNDIHDTLVRAVAVLECNFLGQDFHSQDGFRRNVPDFAEAGNTLAIQQQYRSFASTSASAADLRSERVEQFSDVESPGCANVPWAKLVLWRNVPDDRAAAHASDDDLSTLIGVRIISGRWTIRFRRRRRLSFCRSLRRSRGGGLILCMRRDCQY
jgi:hypothetical protein